MSKNTKPVQYSLSLHSGGILAGAVTRLQLEKLEQDTGLFIRDLFPAGVVAASVGQFPAALLFQSHPDDPTRPLYSAKEYGALFDEGARALSNESIEKPYTVRLEEELISLASAALVDMTPRALQRLIPQYLKRKAASPHMDTRAFDKFLKTHLSDRYLKDLSGSVIFTAGRVDRDPRRQSAYFAKITQDDGSVKYSETIKSDDTIISHSDLSLFNIIKAGTSIPGAMRGHYMPALGEMFHDNGHVFNPSPHVTRLHQIHHTAFDHGHVMLGKLRFFLREAFNAAGGYNDHGILGLFRGGIYTDTTLNQSYSETIDFLKETLAQGHFHDLSINVDRDHTQEYGYDKDLPLDNILLNTPKQRKAIKDLVEYDWNIGRRNEIQEMINTLGENALRIKDINAQIAFEKASKTNNTAPIKKTPPWGRLIHVMGGLTTRTLN